MLFALAPICGVPLSGLLAPGAYAAFANGLRPLRRLPGSQRAAARLRRRRASRWPRVGSVVAGPPPPLTWLLVLLAAVTLWLALGALSHQRARRGSGTRGCPGAPCRRCPVLKEILPDQFAPFLTLFLAFLLAVGLDALYVAPVAAATSWLASAPCAACTAARHRRWWRVVALVPVFVTFDVPLHGGARSAPRRTCARWRRRCRPAPCCSRSPSPSRARRSPCSGRRIDDMHFRLAGAALKTPDATGRPGRARRTGVGPADPDRPDLTGRPLPTGTPAQLATVRRALRAWQVDQVVIAGASRDPVYASGFFTVALGARAGLRATAPGCGSCNRGGPSAPPATGASLSSCRAAARGAERQAHRRCPCPAASSLGGRARAWRQRRSGAVGRRLGVVQPILHLSIPVRDMDEARDFYVHTLGCQAARTRAGLHRRVVLRHADHAAGPPGRGGRRRRGGSRHFGVTLGRDEFDAMIARLSRGGIDWVVPVSTDDEGWPPSRPRPRSPTPAAT